MEGLSGPKVWGIWRFRRLALAAALLTATAAVILLSDLPEPVRVVTSGIGMVGGALATALCARIRANNAAREPDQRAARRRKRAWNLFALGSTIAALSNLLLVSSTAFGEAVAGAATITLYLALLTVGTGVAMFPPAPRRSTDLGRMALDGVVLAGSVLFVLSVIVFPDLLTRADDDPAFRDAVFISVADVIIGNVAALLFLRAAPQDRRPLGLAALGFFTYAWSDFAYGVSSIGPATYSFGTITDIGWILGYAFFTVAVASPGTEATPHGERPVERRAVLGTLAMF